MTTAYQTERVGELIVQVFADDDGSAGNPRDYDNITVIYGSHNRYRIGDGEPPADEMRALERGGIRLLHRYLRRFGDMIAFTKLGMYDHSGISYYAVPMGNNGHAPFDSAGWDSGVVGYAYVTRARANELGAPIDDVNAQMVAEIQEYSDWASGNVWGYRVSKPCLDAHHDDDTDDEIAECPHSDEIGSCWGFIGDPDYALTEGRAEAAAITEEV